MWQGQVEAPDIFRLPARSSGTFKPPRTKGLSVDPPPLAPACVDEDRREVGRELIWYSLFLACTADDASEDAKKHRDNRLTPAEAAASSGPLAPLRHRFHPRALIWHHECSGDEVRIGRCRRRRLHGHGCDRRPSRPPLMFGRACPHAGRRLSFARKAEVVSRRYGALIEAALLSSAALRYRRVSRIVAVNGRAASSCRRSG